MSSLVMQSTLARRAILAKKREKAAKMTMPPRLRKIGANLWVYCTDEDAPRLRLARIFAERGFLLPILVEASKKKTHNPPKNLAARDLETVPNAPNVLTKYALWRRDGTCVPRAAVDEMLRMRGREPPMKKKVKP